MKNKRPAQRQWALRVTRSLIVVLALTHETGCVLPDVTVRDQTSDSGIRVTKPDAGRMQTPPTDSMVPAQDDDSEEEGVISQVTPPAQDACLTDNGGCDVSPRASCSDDGVVHCACPSGYTGDGMGEEGCAKADQCERDNGGCDTQPMATCTTGASGAVTCSCPSGYVGNGVGSAGCGDSNECLASNGGCDTSPFATCTNLSGAQPFCLCPAGYSGTGRGTDGCLNINECLTNNGGCDTSPMAACTDTTGSRTCRCPAGYSGTGVGSTGCSDINECLTGNGGCDTSPMATCTNTLGGRTCTCPSGTSNSTTDQGSCYRLWYTDYVVTDYQTSLVWERTVSTLNLSCATINDVSGSSFACSWSEATAYCSNLTLGGYSDWRLPTASELLSLVDTTVTAPKIISTEAFPNTPSEHFWTSTPYSSLPGYAWYTCFCDGIQNYEPTTLGHHARCVRSL